MIEIKIKDLMEKGFVLRHACKKEDGSRDFERWFNDAVIVQFIVGEYDQHPRLVCTNCDEQMLLYGCDG